jgi:hypothetical protein
MGTLWFDSKDLTMLFFFYCSRRFVNVTSQVGGKRKMNPAPTAGP